MTPFSRFPIGATYATVTYATVSYRQVTYLVTFRTYVRSIWGSAERGESRVYDRILTVVTRLSQWVGGEATL